jgi:hypothetical protein
MRRTPTTFAATHALRAAAALAVCLAAVATGGCKSEPDTILLTDLPQVPGMTARDTDGLRQQGERVVAGQFAYKGPLPDLAARVAEVKARFELQGWRMLSEAVTGSTAVIEFTKDERRARVELIRNGVQPKMSTAVLRVEVPGAAPAKPAPPAATAAPAPAAKP